jgi:hypothetical protein
MQCIGGWTGQFLEHIHFDNNMGVSKYLNMMTVWSLLNIVFVSCSLFSAKLNWMDYFAHDRAELEPNKMYVSLLDASSNFHPIMAISNK